MPTRVLPQVEDDNILEVVDVLLIRVNSWGSTHCTKPQLSGCLEYCRVRVDHLFTPSFTSTALLYMAPTEIAFSLYPQTTFSPGLTDSYEKL
jgi:hypothetical protein